MGGIVACDIFLAQFLPDDTPQILLQCLSPSLDMLSEDAVDHGLIATAASGFDMGAEPFKNLVIQANGDPGFAREERNNGSPFSPTEIVGFSHIFFSYCLRSFGLAFLADMTLISSPRPP